MARSKKSLSLPQVLAQFVKAAVNVSKLRFLFRCQVDRNLQPLYSNCQTKSDESSNSAAASLHRRLEKPHKFSEKASDIRGRPRKRKDQNVQPTPEATSIVTVTQMPILHNPDILSHEGNQMIVDSNDPLSISITATKLT